MTLIALQSLKWGDRVIQPGECVPAGEPGRNYDVLHRLGMIEERATAPQTKVESDPKRSDDPRIVYHGPAWVEVMDDDGNPLAEGKVRPAKARALLERYDARKDSE